MLHWKVRKVLNVLDRRIAYLVPREAIRVSRNQPASFDAVEAAALSWAADTLRRLAEEGKLDESAMNSLPDVDMVAIASRAAARQTEPENQTEASVRAAS